MLCFVLHEVSAALAPDNQSVVFHFVLHISRPQQMLLKCFKSCC